ncbi:sensor histidine kinase [Amycolatopsis rubida]|uniref:histidine kinase n=2 Tax=Amycolatopsis rubida TaxID=112413 RepID=A0ABX0C5S5_9PSEU|nr:MULTISPECIES: histidine kinase [Amycolatopsis]MYW97678.1 sensor histidine kinase [Amycolatopsis rubida]NEC62664.1 sensor histidine kinase [Amycolatopsis rubida]OAP28493.1 Sensor histidine kinase DesK [Amycolatopsis sp. M39]
MLDLPLYAVFVALGPNVANQRTWQLEMIPTAFLLPLLFRRRFPRTVAVLILIGVAVVYTNGVWAHDRGRSDLAMAVVLYTLVKAGDRWFIGFTAAAVGLDALWGFTWGVNTLNPTLTIFGPLPLYLAAWALGAFVRAKEQLAEEERLRAELAASEEQAHSRASVAEERTRIARELHDVLAHSMSVIVLNAEGAKLARHHDPDAVDRTLDTISKTGRSALAELRRLLEVMHAGEPARAPQPTLDQLRTLVAQSGRDITLEVDGDIADLPAGVALQAYRIVQEALTNMLKHAPPDATGRVRVVFAGPEIHVEVTNSGGRQPVAAGLPGSGRGLVGMAQRVAMYHGRLETGALPDGGYRVSATLRTDAA